jgi:MFS transporter, DHA2 family, multidrug resistance protein
VEQRDSSPRDVVWLARLSKRTAQDQRTYSILERMPSSQSHLLGAIDFFWLTGWVLVGLVAVMWLARPPFGATKVSPAE